MKPAPLNDPLKLDDDGKIVSTGWNQWFNNVQKTSTSITYANTGDVPTQPPNKIGDIHVDTKSNTIYVGVNNQSNSGWVTGTGGGMVGPQGPAGPQGPVGPQGPTGSSGGITPGGTGFAHVTGSILDPTARNPVLASTDFSNQGTTTTVLHGNANGTPSFTSVVEADIVLANNTTNNVSVGAHGFCPIAPANTSVFLRGDGTWAAAGGTTPTGTGYRHVTSGVEDAAAATGYLLTGKQTFGAGSGTYTPTAGTTAILVEVQAAGGGGGGASNFLPGTANGPSAGSGGAGGGYAKLWITSLAGSYSYAVGAGGAGGQGGYSGANGSAGGNSTFGSGPIITCNGGPGGYGSPCVPPSTPQITAQSKYGGTASGGDFNIPGMNSFHGWFLTAGNVYAGISGDGGNSILGSGGKSVYYSVHYGTDGGGYGAGGSGSVNYYNSGVYVNGGHGTDGIIIIWEFK